MCHHSIKNGYLTTMFVVVFSLLLQLDQNLVIGFSTGTGGCDGGTAAVTGLHLNTDNNRMVVGGTLLDGEIRVSIDGRVLTPEIPQDFPINQDLTLTVDAGENFVVPYRGLLIRLEAPVGIDTTAALISGTNTQNTATCIDPIIGITHTNRDEKTTSSGTIRFDEEVDNVQLDVTVVFANNATTSAYVYSRLPVNFRNNNNAAVVPTESPITIQFDNPVVTTMLPTIAPIAVSTPVAVSNVTTANPTITPQVTVPVPAPTNPALPPLASSPSPTLRSGVEFDETKQPPTTGTDVVDEKTEKKGKKSKKSKSGKGQSPSKKKGSKKGKKSSKQ